MLSNRICRYASTGVVFALELVTIIGALAAAMWVKGINQKRCFELAVLTVLIVSLFDRTSMIGSKNFH